MQLSHIQHILEIVIAQIQFAHYLSFIFVYLIYLCIRSSAIRTFN